MAESNALVELTDLINQSSQEFEALRKTVQENEPVNLVLTTQAMRTLHAMKGLNNLCGLQQAALITHKLETVIDQIAHNKIKPDETSMTLLSDANTLLLNIAQQGEAPFATAIESINARLNERLQVSQAATPAAKSQSTDTSTIDYSVFGISIEDLVQIEENEKAIANQIFEKQQPIVGYLAHLNIDQLEATVNKLSKTFADKGTMIGIVPTHSKLPQYPYAFVFVFTTTLPFDEIKKQCTFPGKLTWLIKNQPTQEYAIAGQQAQPVPKPQTTAVTPTPMPTAALAPAPTAKEPEAPNASRPAQKHFMSDAAAEPTKINFDLLEQIKWAKKEDPLLHVPISKIDALIDHNNRLISAKIKLERLVKKLKSGDKGIDTIIAMEELIQSLDKHLKLSQKAILNARLVAADTIFSDIGRIVKSIAQESSKKINFEMVGREVEIDKSILEGLQNPLIHLIKNAADHALKPEAERVKLGKPAEGNLRITFAQQGDKVRVSVEDDGEGLDVKAIKKKALEKGLIDAVKITQLTDKEIYQFIFSPGFSTKETLTQTSGRGIGMNSVKMAIEKMHGELFLESEAGKGTKFTISIPSFLSVQRLLRFTVANNHYALPFTDIVEVVAYDKDLFNTAGTKQVCIWQGKSIEAYALHTLLHLPEGPTVTKKNILIVRHNKQTIAMIVDDIMGQEEIIVRPLDMQGKKEFELYSGHADFGDDKLVLIINVDKLWELIV